MKKIKHLLVLLSLFAAFWAVSVSAATVTKGSTNVSSITPDVVKTGDESISSFAQYNVAFTAANAELKQIDYGKSYAVVLPVTIPEKGELHIDVTGTPTITSDLTIKLYSNAACSSKVSGGTYIYMSGSKQASMYVPCSTAGTYYLAVYSSNYSSFTQTKVSFRAYFYSSADRTLKNKTWTASGKNSDSTVRYYKVSLSKAGHIMVQSDQSLSVEIRNSKKATLYEYVSLNKDSSYKASFFLKAGTYYISTKGASDVYKLRYTYYGLGASGFKVKNKGTITVYPGTSKAYQYIQYKAGVTGYVTLTQPGSESGSITLCNSKRSAISSEEYISGRLSDSNCLVYGVKKNTKYYIRIKSSASPFKISVKETKVNENSGASIKKAVNIKSGKKANGTIQAGSKTADWYKFTVTKKKSVSLTVKGNTDNRLNIQVYDSKKKDITYGGYSFYRSTGTKNISLYTLNKGTYYIKVSRKDKSSGYYTLKWK